jgi:hypothetical protein
MEPKNVKTLQFWGAFAAALLGAGFSIGMLLGNYAKADDLERTRDELRAHVAESNGRMSALEATTRNVESDYHSVREQLWRIADRVGAQRVPVPPHVRDDR